MTFYSVDMNTGDCLQYFPTSNVKLCMTVSVIKTDCSEYVVQKFNHITSKIYIVHLNCPVLRYITCILEREFEYQDYKHFHGVEACLQALAVLF